MRILTCVVVVIAQNRLKQTSTDKLSASLALLQAMQTLLESPFIVIDELATVTTASEHQHALAELCRGARSCNTQVLYMTARSVSSVPAANDLRVQSIQSVTVNSGA
jgi:uncharacterized membrane protein